MIEMQAGIFNTSNSNLWTKLRRVFATEINLEYAKMRQSKFTEENLMKYLYGEQISQIPQRNYNLDMQNKYLNFGNQFLHALHGNGYSHMKRWVRERLFFLDTLLDYTVSSADYITVRANKQGAVYLDIQTYVPMYARVKWRDEANNTGTQIKKINRGETVRFDYIMPTATDQEVLIYGGRYLKDIGDLTNLQPTTLLISKAPKLTRLICTNNPNLINTDLSNCTMLQEIDLHGCSQLGGGIGSTPTLNVQKCTNLRRINIYDTKLTAIYTNTSGGNIQEINYPFTVQTVQIHNQPNLTSIGIPVYFIENGNSNNKFATSLVSVDIANCTRLTSMVKNYYEKNGEPVPVPTFLGVSSAQSFKISNSLTHLEKIDLSYCANLRSLSISDFYNLLEINFDDICRWDATHSNLSEISITNCPYVETVTFNQNTLDGNNSLGVAFTKGMTLDLSDLLNLKHIRSNVGVKGLERLIVPPTVKTLVFDYPQDTQYSQQLSDVKTIVSRVAYEQMGDEYEGIDLRGIDTITDFSMGSLASIDRADNLNIKITNTFPYFNYFRESNFFEPTGSVDISDYTGSLAYLFKGISVDKLQIICNNRLTQTNASYMFAYASCDNEELITNLFDKMRNISNLSYMFYNSNIKKAPLLPLETRDCRYTFYNCKAMKQTPSNWNQNYTVTPQSQYCYTGCVGIEMIDNEPSTLDNIPTAWGGFGRSDKTYRGYEIYANDTLEREIEVASASGLSLHNLAKEYGTTPTVTHDQPSFNINEGMDSNILIIEGEYDKALLHGQTYTNLVGRTGETQLFERQVSSFDISEGLESGVDVVDGEFVEAMLYGSTLQNIVVEDGKTSPITNKTKTFNIDDNIAEGELVANGEFASMVIKGNTLKNTLPKSGQTDIVEVRGHENVDSLVDGDLVLGDGEMEHLIMEGQTLVNLCPDSIYTNQGWSGDLYKKFNDFPLLIKGRKYTIYAPIGDKSGNSGSEVVNLYIKNGEGLYYSFSNSHGTIHKTFVMGDALEFENFTVTGEGFKRNYPNVMIIEGEWALHEMPNYFEGMASCKMPVLKVTGKNLYPFDDINFMPTNLNTWYMSNGVPQSRWGKALTRDCGIGEWFYVEEGYYSVSCKTTYDFNFHVLAEGEKIVAGSGENNKFFSSGWYTIRTKSHPDTLKNINFSNIQIEKSIAATPYEPYKSNILHTPEEVVLRSLPNGVCDTLNLNTGEYVQRIKEIVLDGSSRNDLVYHNVLKEHDGQILRMIINNCSFYNKSKYGNCDKLPFYHTQKDNTTLECVFPYSGDNHFYIQIKTSRIDGADSLGHLSAELKQSFCNWLAQNPLTVQYELATPIVKTVDLSIVDQDGNSLEKMNSFKNGYILTSSEQIPPTVKCTLPTSNYYRSSQIKPNTQYTLIFKGSANSVDVGGVTTFNPTSPMLVTTGSQDYIKFSGEVSEVMMFEGDVRDQEINYFTGEKSIRGFALKISSGEGFGKGGR